MSPSTPGPWHLQRHGPHLTSGTRGDAGSGPTCRSPFHSAWRGPAGGCATVVVTRPDGLKRAHFAHTTGPFSASQKNDLSRSKVEKERHGVVEAVVFGG